jgi:hypothetical protein
MSPTGDPECDTPPIKMGAWVLPSREWPYAPSKGGCYATFRWARRGVERLGRTQTQGQVDFDPPAPSFMR